jgi:hypothetical protein
MTIFYCLRLETPRPGGPGPLIYIPQEQGDPVIPPRTGFPFRRIQRLAGLCLQDNSSARTTQKTQPPTIPPLLRAYSWGYHVMAIQSAHWRSGCWLARDVVSLFVSRSLPSNEFACHSILQSLYVFIRFVDFCLYYSVFYFILIVI